MKAIIADYIAKHRQNAEGTLTLPQIREALNESRKIGSVEWIYF
jgi:hypothetical protein